MGLDRLIQILRSKSELLLSVLGISFFLLFLPKLFSVVIVQLFSTFWSTVNTVIHAFVSGSVFEEWLAGMTFVGGYLRQATDIVEAEQEFTEAERNAFRTFEKEVRTLSVQPKHNPKDVGTAVLALDSGSNELETARSQYRETIMAVPGYDDVYGETLPEHMAAEFGDDLAAIVMEGSELTQSVQTLLINQAAEAATQRDKYLDVLEAEYNSLTDANARFQKTDSVHTDIKVTQLYQQSFDELVEYDREIRCATQTCQSLLENRQAEIHTRNRRSSLRTETTLQEYLYHSLDTSFPVLMTALDQLRELNEFRRAVTDSITRRY